MSPKKEKIITKGTIMVSRHFPRNEDMTFEDLEVRKFEVEPATIRASIGMTHNLGNYESARVDAAVTLPCYVEEIEEAFQKAYAIAENKITEMSAEIEEYKKGRR